MDTNITAMKRGRPAKPPQPPNDAVREVRAKLGITQEELAREINCSLSAVRRFERVRVVPSTDALRMNFEKLAAKAGVEMEAPAVAKKVASTRAEVKV